MTQKVTVTKEVAKALESVSPSHNWSMGEVMEAHLENGFVSETRRCLNEGAGKISTDDLMKALVNGFKAETIITLDTEEFDGKTAKDLIDVNKNISTTLKSKRGSALFSYGDGIADGIMYVLNELGIDLDKEV